ncbi:SCO family protein [Bacillus sp. Marseille-P3661]|uniref:SCO family protein n=1 Tax=Bacillus sp. Marseille-P3661 TaxID=1936234 RepID=UPI000C81E2D9|nr:SCO family protein [Bacillus sp. Marseille-P3661]
MNKSKKTALIAIMSVMLIIISACSQSQFDAEYDWPAPEFSFINQDNEQFSSDDLQGKVWLANFIFTNCETVCPPMTANMSKLQTEIKNEELDVQLVSFSVDPERDTPEALTEYATKFNVDHSNWNMLTGYDETEIKRIAKSFKTLAEQEEGTDQFIHATGIYLIDAEGTIVKSYNGLSVPYESIMEDLKALTK